MLIKVNIDYPARGVLYEKLLKIGKVVGNNIELEIFHYDGGWATTKEYRLQSNELTIDICYSCKLIYKDIIDVTLSRSIAPKNVSKDSSDIIEYFIKRETYVLNLLDRFSDLENLEIYYTMKYVMIHNDFNYCKHIFNSPKFGNINNIPGRNTDGLLSLVMAGVPGEKVIEGECIYILNNIREGKYQDETLYKHITISRVKRAIN
jgi:hypothetical protein